MGTSGSCCQTSAKCLGACEPEWVGSTGVHEQSPDILLSALWLGSGQDSSHTYSGLREEACDLYQLDGAWALAAEECWASGRMQTPVRLLSGPPPRVVLCASSRGAESWGPAAMVAGLARPTKPTPPKRAVEREESPDQLGHSMCLCWHTQAPGRADGATVLDLGGAAALAGALWR